MATKAVSIHCTPQVGDGLIYLTLAHLLAENGYNVTFYSTPLAQLQQFFPTINLQPALATSEWAADAENFSKVYLCDRNSGRKLDFAKAAVKDKFVYLPDFAAKSAPKVAQIVDYAQNSLKLAQYAAGNGCVLPKEFTTRRYDKRVILHPTSTDPRKNWPAKKFIKLARRLSDRGMTPMFVVSPDERSEWQQLVPEPWLIPKMSSLQQVTVFIAESGWMIGNDSGIGHLASMCGLPTLTIFRHPSRATLWRPAWSTNLTVSARMPIKWRELWKAQLSVARVMEHFAKLQDLSSRA